MNIELMPLLIFVMVATYTPGPGNITSAGMGMMFGYRRTLRFLMGIAAGYLLVMVSCAFISSEIMQTIPAAEPVLRIGGAAYLLYLAYGAARSNYAFDAKEQKPMSFTHGFCLQALNPKAIIFGLTIYTTFLSPVAHQSLILLSSALLLAALTFSSASLWTLGGAGIRKFLHVPKVRFAVNSSMFVLLVYCAASISGIHLTG